MIELSETGKLPDITAVMARRLRCPSCMRRFRPQDISALESSGRFGVFRLRCPMCNSQRLIMAQWSKNAIRTYVTDLDTEEWQHYRNGPPINVDDVLRVHRMLQTYDGDLSDVLEDPVLSESKR
jgi:hypothetical protein